MGLVASTTGQRNPTVTLTPWRAEWNTTASMPQPLTVVPDELPALTAVVVFNGGSEHLVSTIGSAVTCSALLLPASATAPPTADSLDLVPLRDVLSSATAVVVALNSSAASVVFTGLSASAAQMGQALVLYAECTWTPSGERVRLPPIPLSTAQLALAWVQPPSIVLGYAAVPLRLVVTLSVPATVLQSADAVAGSALTAVECEVTLTNATARNTRLGASDPWAVAIDVTAPAGTAVATATNVTLLAPSAVTVFISAACTAWGHVFTSPPLRMSTGTVSLRQVSAPPAHFVASDASSSWPVEPQLMVVVTAGDASGSGGTINTTDVTCSITTATAEAELKMVDSGGASTLLSMPADPVSGTVAVPRFYVQTATSTPAVELVVECRRTSGDAPLPLRLTIPAVRLAAQLCTRPVAHASIGAPLPPFAVGIVAMPPDGPPTTPCATAVPPLLALPSIVCNIALDVTNATTNDTANIFLQHTSSTMAAASHQAHFDAFAMVAPQGATYGLAIACAVGGLAISPSLPFTVTLAGCARGQEAQGVGCVACGGTTFSHGGIGARCTGCPPAGATCTDGVVALLPRFFRPASQAGAPLGPDTELHPCYNAEACTLDYGSGNSTNPLYGCLTGYTGPMCGVCDTDANYARFGDACAACWSPWVSWLFLTIVIILVVAVLTRVALRTATSRSDEAIALRITLGFLQAVGSLRVFRAGGTKAYDNVMGWTEVVSASPLSVGAFQCLLMLPYLVQYIATILLPALVSLALVLIFHIVTTGRAVHCRPRCRVDTAGFKAAVVAWWATKRYLSTFLFVLFVAYMPIVSISLRALDCIDPVAGIRYLRSDLSVECGVGQHAAARVLAYAVLIALGIGFPAGLARLLATARNEQLVDPAFHTTWGFLFDGYHVPKRVGSSTSTGGTGTGGPPRSGSLRSLCNVLILPSARWLHGAAAGSGNAGIKITMESRAPLVVSGDNRVWWEAVVLARKAGVVLLALLVTNPYLQCVGATLWFLAATGLQVRYAPYTKPLFNRLETASLVTTLLTAIISTALLQYNVDVSTAELHPPEAMTGIEWAVTVLLAVLNGGTFVLLASVWLRLQCAQAKQIVSRTSFVQRRSAVGAVVLGQPKLGLGTEAGGTSRAPDKGTTALASTINPMRALAAAAASSGSAAAAAAVPAPRTGASVVGTVAPVYDTAPPAGEQHGTIV